jgi:hypothetical protein
MLGFIGSLSSFQPSLGRAMRTWAQISSLRPLIKHSLKKASNMPSVLKSKCSNVEIKYFMILDYFNLVKRPKWWVSESKRSYISATNCVQERYPWRAFFHHCHNFHRSGSRCRKP